MALLCYGLVLCFYQFPEIAMEVGTVVQEEMKFRGVEFSIKTELEEGLLTVEISDVMTADQWRGEFDPACELRLLRISSLCQPMIMHDCLSYFRDK